MKLVNNHERSFEALDENNLKINSDLNSNKQTQLLDDSYSSSSSIVIYNELLDNPIQNKNEINLLQENILTLKNLTSRLSFLNREIQYLLKITS